MRFNKYTLIIPDGSKTILYNVITKILLYVDCPTKEINSFFFDNLSKEDEFYYKKRLLISDDDNDDQKEMYAIKETFNHQNEVGRFLIHLGYSCNLNCSYCYQSVIMEKTYSIDPNSIVDFIIKVNNEKLFNSLDVCFIGGEPFLYYDKMISICERLNKNIHINIDYSVVTNGTLLDENHRLSELIKNGVREYQITLDGNKDIHDQYRNDGLRGSFDIIIANIKKAIRNHKDIQVSINCNLTENNYKYVESLLLYLKNNNLYLPFMFSMVFDNEKNIPLECRCYNDIWKSAHVTAIKYGQQYEPFYRDLYLGCALTQEHYYVIGADGFLYKCINAVNNDKYKVMAITDYETNKYNDRSKAFLQYEPQNSGCKNCELYPVCFGGCEHRNNINGFSCEKAMFYNNEIDIIKEIVHARDS